MASLSRSSSSGQIEVLPFEAALGAEVVFSDVTKINSKVIKSIRTALLDNLIILIRGQSLSIDQLLDFGRQFGELTASAPVHIGQAVRTHAELSIISNVIENGQAIGSLGDGEAVWHTDSAFLSIPPSLSILHSIEIPPFGGDTSFTNMYLALERLPRELRQAIRGRTIKHDMRYTSGGQLRAGYDPNQDVRESPGVSHPIVRQHPETANNALYLGRRPFAYINGMNLVESDDLINRLWAHAVKPEYIWNHQWRIGDIIIWDNRCTMHRREAFDPTTRRIMHRTQCQGNLPIESAEETIAHPRSISFIK